MAKFFKNIYIVVSCVVLMAACQEGNEAGKGPEHNKLCTLHAL